MAPRPALSRRGADETQMIAVLVAPAGQAGSAGVTSARSRNSCVGFDLGRLGHRVRQISLVGAVQWQCSAVLVALRVA
jgi:hypothetical protein